MLFQRQIRTDDLQKKIAENIERELIVALDRKGLKISRIHIDMNSGKINVEMGLKEKRYCRLI